VSITHQSPLLQIAAPGPWVHYKHRHTHQPGAAVAPVPHRPKDSQTNTLHCKTINTAAASTQPSVMPSGCPCTVKLQHCKSILPSSVLQKQKRRLLTAAYCLAGLPLPKALRDLLTAASSSSLALLTRMPAKWQRQWWMEGTGHSTARQRRQGSAVDPMWCVCEYVSGVEYTPNKDRATALSLKQAPFNTLWLCQKCQANSRLVLHICGAQQWPDYLHPAGRQAAQHKALPQHSTSLTCKQNSCNARRKSMLPPKQHAHAQAYLSALHPPHLSVSE